MKSKEQIGKQTCKDCQDKLVFGKNWKGVYKSNSYVCIPCIGWRGTRKKRESKIRCLEYLGGRCVDCVKQGREGIFHPSAFDFHHADPSTKDIGINKMLGGNWDRLKKELDKCILLCANCHRVRHGATEERKLNPRPRIPKGFDQKSRKPIKDIDTGQIFESQHHASKHYGVTPQCISNWATGRNNSDAGIHIEYVNDKDLWKGRKSVAKQRKKRGVWVHYPRSAPVYECRRI